MKIEIVDPYNPRSRDVFDIREPIWTGERVMLPVFSTEEYAYHTGWNGYLPAPIHVARLQAEGDNILIWGDSHGIREEGDKSPYLTFYRWFVAMSHLLPQEVINVIGKEEE